MLARALADGEESGLRDDTGLKTSRRFAINFAYGRGELNV